MSTHDSSVLASHLSGSHINKNLNNFIGVANPTFGLQSYLLNSKGAKLLMENCTSANDMSKVFVFVSDDVTALSQMHANTDELLSQTKKNERAYLKMLSQLRNSWFDFKKLCTWVFIENIGVTSNRRSNTEHWCYEIHNKCVEYYGVGKLKKKTLVE